MGNMLENKDKNQLMGISINCHPRAGGDLKLLKKKDTHLSGDDKFGVNRDALD